MSEPSNPGFSLPVSPNTSQAIEDYLDDCRARDLAPKTITSYSWGLRYLSAKCETLPETRRELRPVLNTPHLARESRRSLYRFLRLFFCWAEEEYGYPNPTQRSSPIKGRRVLPRVLTPLEIEDLWSVCVSRRNRALIGVFLDTGLRVGEMAGLRWRHVGPNYLNIFGKVGDGRVPVNPQVKQLMVGLGDGDCVWVGRCGPLTDVGITAIVRRLFDRAGITDRKNGPHTLRHTFATRYIINGGNVVALQQILGHTNLATTMRYVHLAGRDVQEDHAIHSLIFDPEIHLGFG